MESIKGYKYITEESANVAVQLCNQYYGIPTPLNPDLTAWCEWVQIEDFYFISWDESIEVVLGEPIEIMIEQNQFQTA